MGQGLQRVLNLAKKTGDNVIVFDSLNPDNSYVILAINKYENLLEEADYQDFLTEEEMTDKINRDIEPWDIDEQDWEAEDFEANDFLPKHLFDEFDETATDEAEEEWEEDVNYLYPTEDEFTSLRAANRTTEAETDEIKPTEDFSEEPEEPEAPEDDVKQPIQFASDFSSIGELLQNKQQQT